LRPWLIKSGIPPLFKTTGVGSWFWRLKALQERYCRCREKVKRAVLKSEPEEDYRLFIGNFFEIRRAQVSIEVDEMFCGAILYLAI
jgi:hypothetical protein